MTTFVDPNFSIPYTNKYSQCLQKKVVYVKENQRIGEDERDLEAVNHLSKCLIIKLDQVYFLLRLH